jgi:hypothetical protein
MILMFPKKIALRIFAFVGDRLTPKQPAIEAAVDLALSPTVYNTKIIWIICIVGCLPMKQLEQSVLLVHKVKVYYPLTPVVILVQWEL